MRALVWLHKAFAPYALSVVVLLLLFGTVYNGIGLTGTHEASGDEHEPRRNADLRASAAGKPPKNDPKPTLIFGAAKPQRPVPGRPWRVSNPCTLQHLLLVPPYTIPIS